jgi:hypothetical protein
MPQKKTDWNFPLSAEASSDSPPAERDGSMKKDVSQIHLVAWGSLACLFVFGWAVSVGDRGAAFGGEFLGAFRLYADLNRRKATAACPTGVGEEISLHAEYRVEA